MAKLKQSARTKAKTAKKKNVVKVRAAAKSKTHARKVLRKTAAAKSRALLKNRLKSKAKASRSPLKTKSLAKARVNATPKDKRLAKVKAAAKKVLAKIQKLDQVALNKALIQQQILAKGKTEAPGKPGRRTKLTAKEKALVKEFERRELSPADAEARRTRLKNLIVLGKERGYLTYAEINDHLPDDMLDAEQIENIISMINDMGIQVYDEAPDVETLLMSDATPPVTDEDAVEEAEAALSTVDSEFGRTTDPVRMYMREMGSVELLTREGEIEIAKRIEDGLKHMIQAISACPTTIAEILSLAERIEKDEIRVDEVVDGLVDPNAEEDVIEEMAEEDGEIEEEIESAEEEDEDGGSVQSADMLKLKDDALKRFGVIRTYYNKMMKALAKNGPRSRAYLQARDAISAELMNIRFSAKQVEALCDGLRRLVDEVRRHEREIMELCVNKAKMPRQHFIKEFPGKEGNLRWVANEVAARRPWSEALARFEPAIVEQQQKLLDLQARVGIPIKDLKEINRQMSTGEAKARRAKREMTEANLRAQTCRSKLPTIRFS